MLQGWNNSTDWRWLKLVKRYCCWWKESYTSWYGKYLLIFKVLYIPGGAGFLPSTVLLYCYSNVFFHRCCLWPLCFRMVMRGVAHGFTTILAKNTPAFLVDVFWKQWSLIAMLIYQKPLLFSLVFPPCWCEHRWKSCMVKHLFGPFLDLTC